MDFFSSVGTQEILMILLVAILVIGPAKIAEFGKTLGKFTHNIKQASTQFTSNLQKEIDLENKEKAAPKVETERKH